MRHIGIRPFVLGLVSALAAISPLQGQMVTGEQMKDFGAVFSTKALGRGNAFTAFIYECSLPGAIVYPGERVEFKAQVQATQDIKLAGTIEVIAYGTRAIPGDIWKPEVFGLGTVQTIPVSVDLKADGWQNLVFSPDLPEQFGGYGLVLDLGESGRQFLGTCVRAMPNEPRKVQYPLQGMEKMEPAVLERMGIRGIRADVRFVPPGHPTHAAYMASLREQFQAYARHNVSVIVEFGGSLEATQLLGAPRPHLDDAGVMLTGVVKKDMAWSPAEDAGFHEFVKQICGEFGWPKGCVTAVKLWNEPWEGRSISGWQADMLRYREMTQAMGEAVFEARREYGVDVLVGGADSSMNTFDKFFSDGSDDFLKYLDFCSIHYQQLDPPAYVRQWAERKMHKGRVLIWDTESWVANTDDRIAGVIAAFRAAGYDRTVAIYGGNAVMNAHPSTRDLKMDGGTRKAQLPQMSWAMAASVCAMQSLLGERPFNELLFQDGLPWVYVFDGEDGKEDDGTLVILGDLSVAAGENSSTLLRRSVRSLAELEAKERLAVELGASADAAQRKALSDSLHRWTPMTGARMLVKADPEAFAAHDFYGNLIAPRDGYYAIPLDERGYYLKARPATPGAMRRLKTAVRQARIEGLVPVEIIARDMLRTVGDAAAIPVRLSNVLNRTIEGTLSASVGSLQVAEPGRIVLAPHEVKEIELKIVAGSASPSNAYPAVIRFDAGKDGQAVLRETLHVNRITRRTIEVNGDLTDWNGVLPQVLREDRDDGQTLTEAAWLPFVKYEAKTVGGQATAWMAADDSNFYFAAKIVDATPDPGMIRYAKLDADEFFYPAVAYSFDEKTTNAARVRKWDTPARAPFAPLVAPGSTERHLAVWEGMTDRLSFDVKVPEGKSAQVTFYFLDDDFHELGRRQMWLTVSDPAGKSLIKQTEIRQAGEGTYAPIEVTGDVRVTVQTRMWLPATVAAVFVDQVKDSSAKASSARLVSLDRSTQGNWPGTYGSAGRMLPGQDSTSEAVAIAVVNDIKMKELRWPENVRRFTYRKSPELPSGTRHDNVQLAFNAIPAEEDSSRLTHLPGRPVGYSPYPCTDHEYALNPVADAYGGGFEVWRLFKPGMPRKHFYPRQPASPLDGAVPDAQLSIRYVDGMRIVEAAIPWSEMPAVEALRKAGRPLRFTFRINANSGTSLELAKDRSVSKVNPRALHDDWSASWANEIEFAWE